MIERVDEISRPAAPQPPHREYGRSVPVPIQPDRRRARSAPATLPGGGGWLRIALAVGCMLTTLSVWPDDVREPAGLFRAVALVALTVAVVARPGGHAPLVMMFLVLAVRVATGGEVLDAQLVELVVLLPLVNNLAALAAVVPVRSSVQWVSLLPTGMRWAGTTCATVFGLLIAHLLGW